MRDQVSLRPPTLRNLALRYQPTDPSPQRPPFQPRILIVRVHFREFLIRIPTRVGERMKSLYYHTLVKALDWRESREPGSDDLESRR